MPSMSHEGGSCAAKQKRAQWAIWRDEMRAIVPLHLDIEAVAIVGLSQRPAMPGDGEGAAALGGAPRVPFRWRCADEGQTLRVYCIGVSS